MRSLDGTPVRSAREQRRLRRRPNCRVDVREQGVVCTQDVVQRASHADGAHLHRLVEANLGIEQVQDRGPRGGDPSTGHASPDRLTPPGGWPPRSAKQLAVDVDLDDQRPERLQHQAVAVGHLVREVLEPTAAAMTTPCSAMEQLEYAVLRRSRCLRR